MTLNVETCPTHEVSSWSAYVSMCMRIASIVDEYIALLYTDNPIPNSTNKNHGTNPKFFLTNFVCKILRSFDHAFLYACL